MNKYSLLIVILSLFGCGSLLAQADPAKEALEKKQETVKAEEKPKTDVKVVPAVKKNNVKPERVDAQNPRNARPGGNRPARNIRPSGRPVRPGNGRN